MNASTGRIVAAAPRRTNYENAAQVRTGGDGFDADAWHVMNERDNALIADDLLNGSGSSKFVYSFKAGDGSTVAGISVVGARHLANHYQGLTHRLVASVQKTGELFTFTSYPQAGMPMEMRCAILPELREESDFYGALVEVKDIKTGNTIQVEVRENRWETRSARNGGGTYERQHYSKIAQAKAYRNGVLSLIPQDVARAWMMNMLELGKDDVLTASVIDQKRDAVIQFAAARGIPVSRMAVGELGMSQISGLSEAARGGSETFLASAEALGVLRRNSTVESEGLPYVPQERPAQPQATTQSKQTQAQTKPPEEPPPHEGNGQAATKPAAKPTQTTPAAAQQTAAPAPAQTTAQAQTPAQAAPAEPAFEAYPVNEQGEVVDDAFTDPLKFARRIQGLYADAFPMDRMDVLANNEEGIMQAVGLDAQAAQILQALGRDEPAEEPAAAADPAALLPFTVPVIPIDRTGKPSYTAWNELLKVEIASLNPASVIAFIETVAPAVASAPAAARPKLAATLVARCSFLNIMPPSILAEAVRGKGPAPAPATDTAPAAEEKAEETPDAADRKWADQIMADVRACATGADAFSLGENAAVKSRVKLIKLRNQELFEEINAAFAQKIAGTTAT